MIYRLYALQEDGRIVGGKYLDAANDAEAVDKARQARQGTDYELWCGPRVVGRISSSRGMLVPAAATAHG